MYKSCGDEKSGLPLCVCVEAAFCQIQSQLYNLNLKHAYVDKILFYKQISEL